MTEASSDNFRYVKTEADASLDVTAKRSEGLPLVFAPAADTDSTEKVCSATVDEFFLSDEVSWVAIPCAFDAISVRK